jgi:hypothetical protein
MDGPRGYAEDNKCERSRCRETSVKVISWETEKKNEAITLRFILGGRTNWMTIVSKAGMWS